MWVEHSEFTAIVHDKWGTEVQGPPSYRITHKLRLLRANLIKWNWSTFGNINHCAGRLQMEIESMEQRLQTNWSTSNEQLLQDRKEELQKVLRWQSDMLFQQTRAKWIAEGDKNTKFFHAIIKDRRRRNKISLEQPDGNRIKEPNLIGQLAANHFGDPFSATYHLDNQLFAEVPQSLSEEMNHDLCVMPSELEIWFRERPEYS